MARLFLFLSVLGKVLALVLWIRHLPPLFIAGAFILPDLFALYHLLAPSAQGFCRVFTRFETTRSEIWLTIDDGPDETDTPQILDLLDRHCARATFFVIGQRAAQHPALIAEILRRGHDLGHHTHTHPVRTFWFASPARVRAELDDALSALRATGAQVGWFRPPVGIKNFFLADALSARGLRCVGWSIRSYDSISRDPQNVARRVMAQLRPGAIIVMHEGERLDPRLRLRALEIVLDGLARRNFRCILPDPAQMR